MLAILNTYVRQTGMGILHAEASMTPDSVVLIIIDAVANPQSAKNQNPQNRFRGSSSLWILRLEVDQGAVGGIRNPQTAGAIRDDTAGQLECPCGTTVPDVGRFSVGIE